VVVFIFYSPLSRKEVAQLNFYAETICQLFKKRLSSAVDGIVALRQAPGAAAAGRIQNAAVATKQPDYTPVLRTEQYYSILVNPNPEYTIDVIYWQPLAFDMIQILGVLKSKYVSTHDCLHNRNTNMSSKQPSYHIIIR
jgi:hypothetical protein